MVKPRVKLADPVEREVYFNANGTEMRRIIGVHTGVVTRTRKGERVQVTQTWVTYNDGGNTNSRCQTKAFRRWIRTSRASVRRASDATVT